ncbi:hypothetical protein [Marinactinospora rubrisoli]|uniref:Folylpolyglutamate synthase n=1 Tax=Marinactinospora rubrisoli TaxID=2715399 RepID=A0ABW2KKV0_9ACTN
MNTDVFFTEWNQRAPGQRRDLGRCAALLRELGIAADERPVLGVVGSKGKGTAATYASAYLSAAGLDVVTVTSPGLRGNRDRLRINGAAVDEGTLAKLADELAAAIARLPAPEDGYLSPSGLFLAAGALLARARGADVLVLEAGMGGRGDELSLFAPRVVALTTVFAEHIGVLGDTVEEIAWEKASVAGPATEIFVHLPLRGELGAIARRAVRERTSGRVDPERVRPQSTGLPASLFPRGLPRLSAELGCLAAARLLTALHRGAPAPLRLRAVLETVTLPARLSHHRVEGTETEVVIDSAIDRAGISAAVAHARQQWSDIDHVLLCLPDHKDVDGAVLELGAFPVTTVVLPDEHLKFERPLPPAWRRITMAELTAEGIASLGTRVLVLGTVYFTGRVLELVGADTERLFTV